VPQGEITVLHGDTQNAAVYFIKSNKG